MPTDVPRVSAKSSQVGQAPAQCCSARWLLCGQGGVAGAVEGVEELFFVGPAGEVQADHLVAPLGEGVAGRECEQQSGDQGAVQLNLHAGRFRAQQRVALEHVPEEPEEQFHLPPMFVSQHHLLGGEIPQRGGQNQFIAAALIGPYTSLAGRTGTLFPRPQRDPPQRMVGGDLAGAAPAPQGDELVGDHARLLRTAP